MECHHIAVRWVVIYRHGVSSHRGVWGGDLLRGVLRCYFHFNSAPLYRCLYTLIFFNLAPIDQHAVMFH